MKNRKKLPCKTCGVPVTIRSKGECPPCRAKTLSVLKEGSGGGASKFFSKPNIGRKTKRKPKISTPSTRPQFFKKHLEIISTDKMHSEESGNRLEGGKVNICHILPKRKSGGFPSLAECDLNIVYLTWQEHSRFDKLLDERRWDDLQREFPNTWGIVMGRLERLLGMCDERNKLFFELRNFLTT